MNLQRSKENPRRPLNTSSDPLNVQETKCFPSISTRSTPKESFTTGTGFFLGMLNHHNAAINPVMPTKSHGGTGMGGSEESNAIKAMMPAKIALATTLATMFSRCLEKNSRINPLIGIGRGLTASPIPHHRTYGSRIRRFGRLSRGNT